MKYTLTQSYVFYMGQVVRMYFIQGIPYTFDELAAVSTRSSSDSNRSTWKVETGMMKNCISGLHILHAEECHPLMFDIDC